MNTQRFATLALTCMLTVACSAINRAAEADHAIVKTRGSATSVRPAETVRLQIDLLAQGEDLQQALKALAERTKQATRQAQDWGAKKDSIHVDPPVVATGRFAAPQLADLQPMAFDFEGGSPPPPAEPASELRPIVSATLTADFPLPGKSDTGGLILVERLQQRIAKADLPGLKSLDAGVACATCGPQPGAASLVFVRTVSEAEQESALADAFVQARRSAERLAAAAGMKLGNVREIVAVDELDLMDPMPGLPPSVPASSTSASKAKMSEVIGQSPGPLSRRVMIEVKFELVSATPGESIAVHEKR